MLTAQPDVVAPNKGDKKLHRSFYVIDKNVPLAHHYDILDLI